jgi:hypothetical protein
MKKWTLMAALVGVVALGAGCVAQESVADEESATEASAIEASASSDGATGTAESAIRCRRECRSVCHRDRFGHRVCRQNCRRVCR